MFLFSAIIRSRTSVKSGFKKLGCKPDSQLNSIQRLDYELFLSKLKSMSWFLVDFLKSGACIVNVQDLNSQACVMDLLAEPVHQDTTIKYLCLSKTAASALRMPTKNHMRLFDPVTIRMTLSMTI